MCSLRSTLQCGKCEAVIIADWCPCGLAQETLATPYAPPLPPRGTKIDQMLFGAQRTSDVSSIPVGVKCHLQLPDYAPWDDEKWGWPMHPGARPPEVPMTDEERHRFALDARVRKLEGQARRLMREVAAVDEERRLMHEATATDGR